jgi:hypothetical protein
MTPEGKVKAAVKKILTEAGAWYCTPLGAGYGRAGVPDFIVCHRGKFVAIECKAGKGKTTALQDRELAAIGGAGGHTFVIREDGLGYLKTMLKDCV